MNQVTDATMHVGSLLSLLFGVAHLSNLTLNVWLLWRIGQVEKKLGNGSKGVFVRGDYCTAVMQQGGEQHKRMEEWHQRLDERLRVIEQRTARNE